MQIEHENDDATIEVRTETYRWTWDRRSDVLTIHDSMGRTAATAPLQPAVPVVDDRGQRICSSGPAVDVDVSDDRVSITYAGVNGHARLLLEVGFADQWFSIEEVRYQGPNGHRVVALHHFAEAGPVPIPALQCEYLIQPGVSMSTSVSPVLGTESGLSLTSWLGRGSMGPDSQIHQQWGLPVHYFCGVSRVTGRNARDSLTSGQSDAFCCGLATLPSSDMLLQLGQGSISPIFNSRQDLWSASDTSGDQLLASRLVWTFGTNYRNAARNYYQAVSGTRTREPSTAKRAALRASQFNTWGAQCAMGKAAGRFDETALQSIYEGMHGSGMRPGMFVIDDKWEGRYGVLHHDEQRFPHFQQFLQRVREDGQLVGLWAAFLRTNDPAMVGLQQRHLMHDMGGNPISKHNAFDAEPYYLLDPSQDEVRAVLTEQIKLFARRYDPDLVKFDFGYELPSLSIAQPANEEYSGERLLLRALDIIVSALRQVKPDIAVMYYSLSPLLLDFVDQHCHDDMYLCVEDYAVENNRRLFFSSMLGEIGVAVYGSGGYDWRSMRDIWFDTAIAGPVGSLNTFEPDEHGQLPNDELIALFNGLSALSREPAHCVIEPVAPVTVGGSTGAQSNSWLRYENGNTTGVALRAEDADRSPAECGVWTDVTAMVTSLNGDALTTASQLGIVAFGNGTVCIDRKPDGRPVGAIYHYFDGTSRDGDVEQGQDFVRVTTQHDVYESPVEWIELSVKS